MWKFSSVAELGITFGCVRMTKVRNVFDDKFNRDPGSPELVLPDFVFTRLPILAVRLECQQHI